MGISFGPLTGSVLRENLTIFPETGRLVWATKKKNVVAGREAGFVKAGDRRNGGGYRLVCINRKSYRAHQLVWLWCTGCWPAGELDHINGDRADNRIDNLREATVAENRTNKVIQSNNKSGFKWVSWHPQARMWRAELRKNGRRIFDFLHSDPKVAYEAACTAAREAHGTFFNPGR